MVTQLIPVFVNAGTYREHDRDEKQGIGSNSYNWWKLYSNMCQHLDFELTT